MLKLAVTGSNWFLQHIVNDEEITEITQSFFCSSIFRFIICCFYTGGDKVKFYKVATSAGIIKHAFHLGDLSAYTGDVKANKNKVVSVRQAALEINAANKFTVNRCKCKGKCKTAQCSCIRSHISCSNHCHPGSKCENSNLIQKKKPRQEEILNAEDIQVLENGWLTDTHMLKTNNILKKD